MAETGDIIHEFKSAKPPEKALIILAVFAVIGIALYWRAKHAQSQVTVGTIGTGGPTASTGGGGPFPTVSQGQIPVLPQGVSPVYDQSGNVVAYGPGTTTNPPTNTIPPLPSTFGVMTRGLWAGQSDNGGGVPVWTDPNANWNAVSTSIPLNQQVQIGTSVKGNYFGKQATYYPISYKGQQGYIGSWDLANIPQAAGAVGRPHGIAPQGVSYTRKMVRGHTIVTATYSRRGRQ